MASDIMTRPKTATAAAHDSQLSNIPGEKIIYTAVKRISMRLSTQIRYIKKINEVTAISNAVTSKY